MGDKRSRHVIAMMAGVLVSSDPEMAQAVTAAALCFAYTNFDEFVETIEFDETELPTVKLWLQSLTMLAIDDTKATYRKTTGD